MRRVISSLEQTAALARSLAALLLAQPQGSPETVLCVCLQGPMGAGKTTFSRALVAAFPGGEQAEVASPSFTLCNSYPTKPPIVHADLYRLVDNPQELQYNLPEELEDSLGGDGSLLLLEWAEYLPAHFLPRQYLDIVFEIPEGAANEAEQRVLTVGAHGAGAQRLLQNLGQH